MAGGQPAAIQRQEPRAERATGCRAVDAVADRAVEAVGPIPYDAALAYHEHAAEVRAYLLRGTRDPGTADDLTQEAFLRLCLEIQSGRAPANVRAWLYRVARNLVASRGRRLCVRRRWLQEQMHEEPRTEALEWLALLHDRGVRLEIAMDTLPGPTREALLMAASGFSGREIAGRLRRSEVATRTLLCRGRSRLRLLLAEEAADARPARSRGQGRYAHAKGAGARSAPESPRVTIAR